MRLPARLLLFPALLFPAFLLLRAQTAPAGDPFAAESFVIQHEDSIYSYNADGTGFREITLAVTVQSEAALRNFSVVGVAFAANSEKVELHYVRVRRHDGTVVNTPLSEAIEQPTEVTREAPFYSDLKQEQIPVRSLGVGDTLEWQARVVRARAEAPGEFWGQESFPAPGDAVAREASVELRFPKSKAVTVWTDPRYLKAEGAKPPTDTTTGEERVVRWESSALKPTAGPAAEADKEARKKHVLSADEELDAEQGKLPSVAWTTFPSWAAVGAWYRGLQGDRTAPTPEIKARVAELTAGKTSEEDKIRAVYAFASSQIRYIGVAFGIGRYQPHRAEDVLANQYGDCKDKETLLASMLAVLGLHTDAVLIGAGIRFNAAVPSPGAFNHLIARVELPGDPVFLDPTTEVAPYRALLATLRDHEALVIADSGSATVQRTPAALPFAANQEWQAVGTLSAAGVTQSHIVVTFRGDDELVVRSVLRQVPPSSYDELGQRLIASLGFGGAVSHAEFSRPDDTVEPLRFSFDYKRDISSNWDHRIVAQLAPITLPTIDDKDPPTAALNLATLRTEHSTAAITVPEGWRAELPEAIHAKAPWATVDLTYRFDKGTVYTERTLKVLQHKVPASDWPAYKKFQDAANLGLENYISLTHFTKESSGKARSESKPDSPPEAGSNTAATMKDLLKDADQAYKRHDTKALASAIDRMKAIDPKARRVQAWSGSLAILQGHLDQAIADNRKELEQYPDEFDRYEAIAWIQGRKNDKAAMENTLHAWTHAAPDDPEPQLRLASLLLPTRPAEAVEAAQEAVAHTSEGTPSGNGARILLGKAQLKAGQNEAGDKTLTALLHSSEDPGMLNDAAYELADAKLEFPLAEQSSRTAISKLTEETKSWTLDESPQTLQARTSLLIAAWDTMGWILYREGKPREAQPWLAAAWLNGQHTAVHDHLVEVQRALGPVFVHSAEAIDTDKSEQTIRKRSLDEIFGKLKKTKSGNHQTFKTGQGDEISPETRAFTFGDTLESIDFTGSIRNAYINHGVDQFSMHEDDLEIHETDFKTQTSTVLMIDISHSMILYGEDRITPAKKVAMALSELITTRYPKDTLDIVVFGNDAWQIEMKDLPYLEVGPYHTNTVAGLELAMDLLRRRKNPNKQIFMITDGKPTCLKIGKKYYKNSFGIDAKILNRTLNLAGQLRRLKTPVITFMIAQDPYLQAFVRQFTEVNGGKAFYSSLDGLGSFIFEDYERNKRRTVR